MPHTPGVPDALFHYRGGVLHLADPKDRSKIRHIPGGAITIPVTKDEAQPVKRRRGRPLPHPLSGNQ